MKPRIASFFSGIGGFDLGFERAGFEVSFQSEINEFCLSILEKHWPDIPRIKDIRKVANADVPVSDVWAGGFPCQDVSVARMGPRDGLRGKQSGLFYRFADLVREGRPRVVIIENVPGLLSSHGGKDFGIVIQTLAEIGYSVGWRVLNSRYFGVPQSRQRVYIVGTYRDRRGPGQILFESERSTGNASASGQNGEKSLSPFKASVGDPSKGPLTPAMAYCLYACSARHTGTDWSRNYVSYPDGRVRRLLPVEAERLQGFPVGWTMLESEADPEKLDTLRYHALGNAVTVPVAEWLSGRIARYLSGASGTPSDEEEAAELELLLEEQLV